MGEAQAKLSKVRSMLAERQLDAAVVSRLSNFTWLTDGATCRVVTASSFGEAILLVTQDKVYLITNSIEAPRLQAEEPLQDLAPEFRVAPWYEDNPALGDLTKGIRLGADVPRADAVDLSQEFVELRTRLTPAEGKRFVELGRLSADAMNTAIRQITPGMTEFEIAGVLAREVMTREAQPVVNLVATDERIFRVRHPIPTGRKMERYAMLVLCARNHGLVASVTRLIHFGPLSEELRHKQAACARVDATLISRTRPDARLADVFQSAIETYASGGFPDEWKLHHQGGPASYEPRDFVATPSSQAIVYEGQVYAWNPSIAGVKLEDTVLIGPSGNDVLTKIEGWPNLDVEIDGQIWQRPAILEIT